MQLLRVGFFILGLVVASQVAAHENLIKQLELITNRTKLDPRNCATPSESPYFRDKIPAGEFCAAITATAAGRDAHVCTPYFKDAKPHWEHAAIKLETATYATRDAVAASRNAFRNDGYLVGSAQQESELLAKLNRFRNEMMPNCCGSDNACKQALNSVRFRLCKDSEAENNPNAPDSCTLTDGYFRPSLNLGEQYQILKTIYSARSAADRAYIQSVTKISEAEIDAKLNEFGIGRSTTAVAGEVVVTPYFRNGSSKVSDHVLRHEIAHACSSVRRQLAAIRGDSASAISLAIQQRKDDECSLHPKAMAAYSKLLSDVRENRLVSECLYKVAAESTNPASYAFVDRSCPGSKLEEGFAIARAVIEAPRPLVPKTFPNRECSSQPSRKHPASAAISDCLVRNSTSFRKQLLGELRCPR